MSEPGRGASAGAELVCAYLADRAGEASSEGLVEGRFSPPIDCGPEAGEAVRLFSSRKLRGIDRATAEGLCAWARGERRARVLFGVPAALEVLAMQARGERCVSLLPDGITPPPPHRSGVDFALHDLSHLEKLFWPGHHHEQVGFFALVLEATSGPGWAELMARHDAAFAADCEGVFADMNGSAVFLLSLLKMRLRMAARRSLARAEGRPWPERGPLGAAEERAFEAELELLLDLLGLAGELREAARRVSARRDAPLEAERLRAHLASLGRESLARSSVA